MKIFKRISMVLVLLGVLGTLGWTFWQGFSAYQKGQLMVDQGLQGLAAEAAASGAIQDLGLLETQFKQALQRDPRWKGLALVTRDRGLLFFYGSGIKNLPPNGKLTPGLPVFPIWEGQAWKEVTGLAPLKSNQSYQIEGLYEFLTPQEIYQIFQLCAVVLAGLLGYTLLVLILGSLLRKTGPKTPFDRVAAPEAPPSPSTPLQGEDKSLDDLTQETLAHLPDMNTDEEFKFAPPLPEEPALDLPSPSGIPGDPKTPHQDTPEGPSLFSPHTSLSWATFFPKRLDYELERAAAFSQDLVVVLFSSPLVQTSSEAYAEVGREVGRFFAYRDLAFEWENHSYAVVIPGTALEKALPQAQEFCRNMESRFPGKRFFAGLSARSGRLISHPVILKEAAGALEKASSGQDRVVGFKADPERYRQHLTREMDPGPREL